MFVLSAHPPPPPSPPPAGGGGRKNGGGGWGGGGGLTAHSVFVEAAPHPSPLPAKSGAREKLPEISLQHAAINFCQLLQIRHRRALVDLVHGLADQAELDHRAIARDEARVRGAAARAQLRPASGDLLARRDRQIGEVARLGHEHI